MLHGKLLYFMSDNILNEYSSVLRPSLVRLHGRTDDEIDRLLIDLVSNAMWREPVASSNVPVTGERLLIENFPSDASVTSPRRFVDTFLSPKAT